MNVVETLDEAAHLRAKLIANSEPVDAHLIYRSAAERPQISTKSN